MAPPARDASRVVFDREVYGRELAAQVTTLARDAGIIPVAAEEYRGRVDDIPDIVRKLGDAAPDAVVQLCVAGRGTIPMLVSDRRPAARACRCSPRAGSWRCPELAPPPEPEELEAVGPALGPERAGPRRRCDSCSTPSSAGGRDRRRVIAAGLALGSVSQRLAWSSTGPVRTGISGRLQRDFPRVKQEEPQAKRR